MYFKNDVGIWLPGQTVPVKPKFKNVHVLHLIEEVVRNAYGEILDQVNFEPYGIPNILHDEGEQAILSAYFDTDLSGFGAPPANLYLGLDARSSLAEADTLSSLVSEPSGNGYARSAISTTAGFTLTQPAAYYKATSTTETFTASGGSIGAVTKAFLCTVVSGTSGKLIASIALSTSRTLASGESLDVTIAVGLSE